MAGLVELVRSRCPAFTERAMTFEDFLTVCEGEQIVVELKRHPLDEQLIRRPPAKIVLNAGLSERYRTFAGFHALAHWLGHPAPQSFYLGSPGWLDSIELEASQIGLLALMPSRPPYPRLERARMTQQEIMFWIEEPRTPPERALGDVVEMRNGRPRPRTRSARPKPLRLGRLAQTEFQWPPQQTQFRFPDGGRGR